MLWSIVPILIIEILFLIGCLLYKNGEKELFSILSMRHIDYFLFIVPLYLIIINHIYYPQKILNKVLRYFLILFLVEFIVTIDVLGLMIMGHTEFDRMDITIIQLLYILAFLISLIEWWVTVGVREFIRYLKRKRLNGKGRFTCKIEQFPISSNAPDKSYNPASGRCYQLYNPL